MKDKVYVYVFDTLSDWEISYITANLHNTSDIKEGAFPLHIVTMGNSNAHVVSMGGMTILPGITLDQFSFDDAAALILPGGETWQDPIHEPVLALAKECLARGILVGAICGATIALAGAGMLDHCKHTSNDLDHLRQVCPQYQGAAYYQQQPAVTDGYLVTAAGIAPLEFSREIFNKLDIFADGVVEAWYKLYKTLDVRYFHKLVELTS